MTNSAITLTGGSPWGFRIVGGDHQPIVIAKVRAGGKADLAGLREGDRILSINEVNCAGVELTSALELVEDSKQNILLKIQREGMTTSKACSSPIPSVSIRTDDLPPVRPMFNVRKVVNAPLKPDPWNPGQKFEPSLQATPKFEQPQRVTPKFEQPQRVTPKFEQPQRATPKFEQMDMAYSFGISTQEHFPDGRETNECFVDEEEFQSEEENDKKTMDVMRIINYKAENEDDLLAPMATRDKIYADSSFYNDPQTKYPTIEEQIKMARKVAMSLTSPANAKARGHRMFVKRQIKSNGWQAGQDPTPILPDSDEEKYFNPNPWKLQHTWQPPSQAGHSDLDRIEENVRSPSNQYKPMSPPMFNSNKIGPTPWSPTQSASSIPRPSKSVSTASASSFEPANHESPVPWQPRFLPRVKEEDKQINSPTVAWQPKAFVSDGPTKCFSPPPAPPPPPPPAPSQWTEPETPLLVGPSESSGWGQPSLRPLQSKFETKNAADDVEYVTPIGGSKINTNSNNNSNSNSYSSPYHKRGGGRPEKPDKVNPAVAFGLADDLKMSKGKGGKMFAKRRARSDKFTLGESATPNPDVMMRISMQAALDSSAAESPETANAFKRSGMMEGIKENVLGRKYRSVTPESESNGTPRLFQMIHQDTQPLSTISNYSSANSPSKRPNKFSPVKFKVTPKEGTPSYSDGSLVTAQEGWSDL